MKVLVIYGYGRFPWALAERANVEVAVLLHPLTLKYADPNQNHHINTYSFEARSHIDLRAVSLVRRVVRAERPDLIHAFHGKALAASVLATTGMRNPPKIVSFRGVTARLKRRDPGNWISYLHPRVAAHACESYAVRDALIDSGIGAGKCGVTYGCIDPHQLDRPGRSALEKWSVPADAFVVGTIANMRRVKGIDILLKAAIQCAELTNIYWLLIGRPGHRRTVRLAEDRRICDRVRLIGFQPNASALISGVDLFVMPSRSEGLCVSLLEAMSQRVCPIVSDAGGMKEAVRHQQDGLVFPREDAAALAEAIRSLYQDRHRLDAYAESAYTRAVEFFSPERMCDRAMSLYRRALEAV